MTAGALSNMFSAEGPDRVWVRILVRGAVQGVGFRPFVYRQAAALGLSGWVANSAEGVAIEAGGARDRLEDLIEANRNSPPPNATVTALEVKEVGGSAERGFAIREGLLAGAHTAQVLPDLATCDDCLRELLDPADRRYRYPFINCTRCGPRYSIIEAIPYDRARTTMRHFPMCGACRAEYEDPKNRRFHAEPNACPDCGPRLTLWDAAGSMLAQDENALRGAIAAMSDGLILAVKGVGGFHLLVDARNESAVQRLRIAKRRGEKPFAVMFPTLESIRASCDVGPEEESLLTGQARPIVLLRRTGCSVASLVAPGLARLGAFLPYAPQHHLLMEGLRFPAVATSGNISDDPIIIDERDALDRLSGIADLFLVHDRPIVRPVDDSVVQVVCDRPQLLRRARGYAPAPVTIGGLADGIVAFGGHLKSTVALTAGGNLMLSQHLGDLESGAARAAHRRALTDIVGLHRTPARIAVCDAHPDYASSRAAERSGLSLRRVQHHVAHVAAGMAEHALGPPVLGIAWDGAGYGPDGTVWGGEFLLLMESGWQRVAHLRPFALPGGEAAVREPRRAALGLLFAAFGKDAFEMTDLAPVAAFSAAERRVLHTMLMRGVNSPVTTSAGRLFDAFAALCGLRQRAGYEGQAACMLEAAAEECDTGRGYEMPLVENGDAPMVVEWLPALAAALADLRRGAGAAAVASAFHNGLAATATAVAVCIGQRNVVLTGGCFQNARLTAAAVAALDGAGLTPYVHRFVPPNDGGLAVGQVMWASWQEKRERAPCA